MPRNQPLTIKEIEAAKPNIEDYKMADGEGMYLFVTKAGGKHWRMKYRYLGKEKVFTIGEYPYVSLKDVRTNELINARWDEFDLENKQWVIPGTRMKMKKDHIIPLSDQVIDVLTKVQLHSRHKEFVFPSHHDPKKTMSNNTILQGLNRMGYKGKMTGHGFRSLAATTLQEKLGWNYSTVIDRQLAHTKKSKVHAAYDRAEFIEERTRMMQEWADYLDKVVSEK